MSKIDDAAAKVKNATDKAADATKKCREGDWREDQERR